MHAPEAGETSRAAGQTPGSASETPRGAGADRWLLALVAVGLGLRAFVALHFEPRMSLLNDEVDYYQQAQMLVRSGHFDTGDFVRPPLYFLFVAFWQWFVGPAWRPLAMLAQCALGAATAWPVYRMGLRVGGRRVALLAAAFWCFDPTLIVYCHLLWPETLFTFLAAWVFARVEGSEQARAPALLVLGALTGLAMLLKPVFGLFTAILALYWWRRVGFGTAARLALVYGLAVAAVIAPWVLRNQVHYGPSVVLENQGSYNLWVGNSADSSRAILEEWRSLPDPVTRSRVATEKGLAAIADDPLRFVGDFPRKLLRVWGLEYFILRNIVLQHYGEPSRAGLLAAFWTLQVGWTLLLLCAAAGLAAAWRVPSQRPAWLYALAVTLLVSAMLGSTRFRVPFAVPLCVAAGAGAPALLRGRLGRAQLLAVALAASLLVASATRPFFATLGSGRFTQPAELERDDWMRHRY